MKHLLAVLLLVLSLAFNVLQRTSISPRLEELIEAERSFARLAREKGVEASFLANFAEDGLSFEPQPIILKQVWGRRPPRPESPAVSLEWAPTYGDISLAGDLGYSTGPFLINDRNSRVSPRRHGLFFSVWKKQADELWKVEVDLGVQLDSMWLPLDAEFEPAGGSLSGMSIPAGVATLSAMLEAEDRFLGEGKQGKISTAWRSALSPLARIYRPKQQPVKGEAEMKRWIVGRRGIYAGERIRADIARSCEIGYTVGRYEITGEDAATGYWVRIWKLDRESKWKIVFDVTNIAPKE
ncbi:MAG: hypothetical protein IPM66_02680 [Acidobacteriota bacterium]|nr:MAG: hypothetical protein IPM66_02680 [Acidobacteriota bacterium]